MDVQKTINHARGGTLPINGIYSGVHIDQLALAPNTDFIDVTNPPNNCHCFIGNKNFTNSQICFVPTNRTDSIVSTNGMNGCAIYIYKANNHFIFFHNWNDRQLNGTNDIAAKINAKAIQDGIANWIPLRNPIHPVSTIRFADYSTRMHDRTGNTDTFCFIPLLFPISATQIRAWFLFFNRVSDGNTQWVYDRNQSEIMDLATP